MHTQALANDTRAAPVKIGSDNPDNLYENARLSAQYVYRVTGLCGTVPYLGFGVQAGVYGGPGGLKTVDYKTAGLMQTETNADGEKTIDFYVSILKLKPPNAVNWVQMIEDPKEHQLIVRQTFMDRTTEIPAVLKIARVGQPTLPANLTCTALDEGLKTSGMFVGGASMMFAVWCKGFQKHTNELPLFDPEKSNKAGGDPHIRYYHSYWALKDDEALVIEVCVRVCVIGVCPCVCLLFLSHHRFPCFHTLTLIPLQ